MSRLSAITSFLIMPPVLLAALLLTTACGDSKGAKAAAPQAMPVKVQTAKAQKVDDTTDYVATLKSRDSAVVMPQVEGIITQIFVHSGERVAAGAPMMQIDPAKQQATVNSQEHARVAIVGDVPVRVGDRVLTTTPLTTVDRPGSLEAYIYVPIEKSAQLKMNLPVQIVDASGSPLASSRITFISPQVDNSTQTVLAKALIANANDSLRTAQFIRARVVWGSQDKPVVPVVAVSRIGGVYFAFVAESDQKGGYVVHQKPLQVGQIVGNNYVVLDGVKPGDKVVVSGTQFLIDGVPVVPQESSS